MRRWHLHWYRDVHYVRGAFMSGPEVIALMAWADAQSKARKPLSLREAFLAGIAYERAGVHPDTTCPHGYRLINLRDGTDTCEGCAL